MGEAIAKYPDIAFYANGIIDFYQEHKDEKFDLVVFSKSLHHCDDLENVIIIKIIIKGQKDVYIYIYIYNE